MTKRKPGRPPKNRNGAMTRTVKFRLSEAMYQYLASRGSPSEVLRQIIEDAKKRDEEQCKNP